MNKKFNSIFKKVPGRKFTAQDFARTENKYKI